MAFERVSTIDTGADYTLNGVAGADGSLYVLKGQTDNAVFRVNADGTIDQVVTTVGTGQLYFGDIDVLSDGSVLLSAIRNTGFGWDTVAQKFGPDGQPATGVFDPAVNSGFGDGVSAGFTVSATPDGGFAFFYNDISHSNDQYHATYPPRSDGIFEADLGGGRDVYARYFDADVAGQAATILASGVETINGGTVDRRAGAQSVYDSTTLTGGANVVAFLDQRFVGQNGGLSSEYAVTVSITSKDGQSAPIKVDFNPFGGSTPESVDGRAGISVLALPDNKFAVTWTEIQHAPNANVFGSPIGWNNYVRYFDGNGNALSDPILFLNRDLSQGNITTYVHAEALPDGRIVFAFNDGVDGFNGTGRTDAYLGIIETNGSASYSRVNEVEAVPGQVYTVQDLVARTDGSFDLIYRDAATSHQLIAHYADAAQPPVDITENWIKSTSASETLNGTTGQADAFFFDTTGGAAGSDKLMRFGTDDVIVTTQKIYDSNDDGIIEFGRNKQLDLTGGGTVKLTGETGGAITKIEYDGFFDDGGIRYFVYSRVGSEAGVHTVFDGGVPA